jgi:hypothetical protein
MQNTPISRARIDEIAMMLKEGTASDEVEREIRKAAKLLPELLDAASRSSGNPPRAGRQHEPP